MRFHVKTILVAILLFSVVPKTSAQSTKKYCIDIGPIKDPLSRKIIRMRYNRDKKRKERLADRIKEKQEREYEKARKASIKMHLANQSPKLRKELEQEMKNGSMPYQVETKRQKIATTKKKRQRHG
ncbi:MAG TPA: hypothetical protein VMW01_05525 [Williamwhitmania sp.]|jgi:hypothetical protein|nr:hypothetical protein [Williamwhitmania sp.]